MVRDKHRYLFKTAMILGVLCGFTALQNNVSADNIALTPTASESKTHSVFDLTANALENGRYIDHNFNDDSELGSGLLNKPISVRVRLKAGNTYYYGTEYIPHLKITAPDGVIYDHNTKSYTGYQNNTFVANFDGVYTFDLSAEDAVNYADYITAKLRIYQVLGNREKATVDLKSDNFAYFNSPSAYKFAFVYETESYDAGSLYVKAVPTDPNKDNSYMMRDEVYEYLPHQDKQVNYISNGQFYGDHSLNTPESHIDMFTDVDLRESGSWHDDSAIANDVVYFGGHDESNDGKLTVQLNAYHTLGIARLKNYLQHINYWELIKSFIGDPVDSFSGGFIDHRTILTYGGNNPLHFDLNYFSSTLDSDTLAGGFTHNFETKLIKSDKGVSVKWSPNTISDFKKTDSGYEALDPKQSSTHVTYDAKLHQFVVENTAGEHYVFNDDGELQTYRQANGETLDYTYENQQLTQVKNNRNQSFKFTYDASHHLATVTDDADRQIKFDYDDNLLRTITMADGKILAINYSGSTNQKQVSTMTYDNQLLIANDYDKFGRVISQTDTKGIGTKYTYNQTETGLITTHETDNVKTVMRHDFQGNLLSKTDGNGHTQSYEYDNKRQQIKTIDPLGNITQSSYDDDGHVVKQTDALGHESAFNYKNQQLSEIITADGSKTSYAYNDKKQLTTSQDATGNQVNFTYDSFGQLATVKSQNSQLENKYDKNGYLIQTTKNDQVTTFENDRLGRAIKTTLPNKTVVTSTYDDNNNLLTSTVNGKTTTYTYDNYGNCLTVKSPTGHTVTNQYDDNHNLVSQQDGEQTTTYQYNNRNQMVNASLNYESLGDYTYDNVGQLLTTKRPDEKPIENEYDADGHLVSQTHGDSKTTMTYDAMGRVTQTTDNLGRQTTVAHDVLGRVIKQVAADGQVSSYEYNPAGQVASVTVGAHKVTYDYDSRGNKLSETDESGHKTTFEYNKYNQLSTATNALGYKTYYEYNTLGQLAKTFNNRHEMTVAYDYNENGQVVKVSDSNGLAQTMTYDASGKLLVSKDANGHVVSQQTYDETDRMMTAINGLNQKSSFNYEQNAGHLTVSKTDPKGNTQAITFDQYQRLAKHHDGVIEGVETYDDMGRLSSQGLDDGQKNKTTYQYDSVGRVTQEQNNDSVIAYTYNISDQIASWTNARGQKTTYDYDADGQVTKATADDMAIDYQYDMSGNTIKAEDKNGAIDKTYDALGRVVSKRFNNQEIKYTYDDRGFMTKLTYPGDKTVTYDYDTAGRVLATTDFNGHQTKYQYDKVNRIVKTINWNGVVEDKTYNDASQVLTIKTSINNKVLTNYHYTYDSNGNLIKDNSVNYTYDSINRLTAGQNEYEYDAIGNITHVGQHQMAYDSDSRLTSIDDKETTVDKDGNLTDYAFDNKHHHGTYDSQNRLTSYDGTLYNYDALGNRIQAGNRNFVYDDSGNVLSDGENTYVYGANGVIGYYNKDNQFITYLFNQRGDAVKETDASGHIVNSFDYNDYGKLLDSDKKPASVFGYGAKYGAVTDENGLVFLKTRFYNPEIMRFMNRDTVAGSITDTKSLNRFAYVEGNPLTNIDPNGQAATWLKNHAVDIAYYGLMAANFIPGLNVVTSLGMMAIDLAKGDYTSLAMDSLGILIPGAAVGLKLSYDGVRAVVDGLRVGEKFANASTRIGSGVVKAVDAAKAFHSQAVDGFAMASMGHTPAFDSMPADRALSKFDVNISSGSGSIAANTSGTISSLDDLSNFDKSILKNGKPKNSPAVKKWINNGGKVDIDKDGMWSYTNSDNVSISYPDGFPDFKSAGFVRQEVNIGPIKNYDHDFKLADETAPFGKKLDTSTWHHYQDAQTMQEVPSLIHRQFTHRGGMSIMKGRIDG